MKVGQAENRSYDAWGSPCNPQTGQVLATANWGIGKGYTGHDHLP